MGFQRWLCLCAPIFLTCFNCTFSKNYKYCWFMNLYLYLDNLVILPKIKISKFFTLSNLLHWNTAVMGMLMRLPNLHRQASFNCHRVQALKVDFSPLRFHERIFYFNFFFYLFRNSREWMRMDCATPIVGSL